MADTDQILQELQSITNRLNGLERGQKRGEKVLQDVKQAQAHTNSALEAVKAGQDDLREKVANLPTRPEFQDLRADIGRKVQDHASRIEDLEKDAGIPHPHKH